MLAWAFSKAGDNDRSYREITAAFDVDSASARPPDYVLLSRALRASGNAAGAGDALAAACKQFPFDADLRYELAVTRRAQKRPADAVYELEALYGE